MSLKLPSLNKKILSIDFGAYEIKLVEAKVTKKEITISKALTLQLPEGAYFNGKIIDEDMVLYRFKEFIKENKVSMDKSYGVISSSDIITREISLPKVDKDEIASIIEYQLNDILPINPREYVIKHMIIGEEVIEGVEKHRILLLGVPESIVFNHLELMEEAELKPEVLDYQGNSMGKLLGFNNYINDNYDINSSVIASIDIGYSNSKINIIKNGYIEISRVIDLGAKHLCEQIGSNFNCGLEEAVTRLKEIDDINNLVEDQSDNYQIIYITRYFLNNIMERIEMVFRYYTTRGSGYSIDLAIIQGGLSNISGIDELFSNYFNIPTIKLYSLDKVNWEGDYSKFANAIGALIRVNEVNR